MHQHKKRLRWLSFSFALGALLFWCSAICAQTTAFTYQGVLNEAGVPANNSYDMQFKLFDAIMGGAQVGTTITNPTVAVANGVFTVLLDFGGSAFTGNARFLEMGVRPAGNNGAYAISPRTQITSTPYAIRALNSSQLNGVDATRIIQTDNNGNVGVGTTSPTSKLDVKGNVTLDAGASPVLYTGTANTDQNRYLQLLNSPAAPSVSGLKAGGLLVADSYSFANPGKNDLIVKGNTGLGTASPQSKLHVFGSSGAFTPFRGLTIDQIVNADTSGYAMKVTTTTLGVTGTNFLIDSVGNVGIGTSSPASNLDVRGHLTLDPSSSPILYTSASSGEKNRYLQLINSPSTASASGLKAGGILVADSFSFANPGKNDLIVKGNAAIGTATPAHRLSISGGPAWTSSGWKGALSLDNVSAIGWEGNTAGWHFGIGQTNGGLYFLRTSSNPGSSAAPANYDMILGDGGKLTVNVDAAQQRDKGGFVKAMVYVNEDATIARCYNSQTSGPNGPCGFTVNQFTLGGYEVNFGFQVFDRFFSVTPVVDSSVNSTSVFIQPSTNSLNVYITASNRGGAATNAPFMVIVY